MASTKPYKRQDILADRRHRLLSRAIYYERGAAFHLDRIFGSDGLPTSSQRGREDKEEWDGLMNMKFLKQHPITVPYIAVALIVGIIWQVGFNG